MYGSEKVNSCVAEWFVPISLSLETGVDNAIYSRMTKHSTAYELHVYYNELLQSI